MSTTPGPASILADRYRLEYVVAEGGMGRVYAATDLRTNQRVAVKVLRDGESRSVATIERFRREAEAAYQLKSKHVVRVLDVIAPNIDTACIVMELLRGQDLQQLLDSRGALAVEEACSYVLQACDAIAEAHAIGIVHRDLKPANLFLARDGQGEIIKVLDFGISKMMHDGFGSPAPELTRTSAFVGSPHYVSPEQLHAAKDVDARTDVWSLGVILFELITGKLPFAGETLAELSASILRDAPRSLSALRPDVNPRLVHVVLKALEKKLAFRFDNIAEFEEALRLAVQGDRTSDIRGFLGTAARQSMTLSGGAAPLDERMSRVRARNSTPPTGPALRSKSTPTPNGATTAQPRSDASIVFQETILQDGSDASPLEAKGFAKGSILPPPPDQAGMSGLLLSGVKTSDLELTPALDGRTLSVRVAGAAKASSAETLSRFLSRLHEEAVRLDAEAVCLDLVQLSSMCSSCVQVLSSWTLSRRKSSFRYRTRVLVDGQKPWQKRTLDTISRMSEGSVEVCVTSRDEAAGAG